MSMQLFTARVQGGAIVPDENVELPEGTRVTVIADDQHAAFEGTPEQERDLLASIREAQRGKVISAADVFKLLSR